MLTSRLRFRGCLLLTLLAVAVLVQAPGASAARWAKPAEAKAMKATFFRHGAHKGDTILNMRVSTVNGTWARIRFAGVVSTRQARAAVSKPGKTRSVNLRKSGPASKPRMTVTKDPPPPKVGKDEDKHLIVYATFQGSGTETASTSNTFQSECGSQSSTESSTLKGSGSGGERFEWTMHRAIDTDSGKLDIAKLPDGTSVVFFKDYKAPLFGFNSASFKFEYFNQRFDCDGSIAQFKCSAFVGITPFLKVVGNRAGTLSADRDGLWFAIPYGGPAGLTCDNGRTTTPAEYGSDRVAGSGGVVVIPFLGSRCCSTDLKAYNFTRADSVEDAEGVPATVNKDYGHCINSGPAGISCNDTVSYSGTVTVSAAPPK